MSRAEVLEDLTAERFAPSARRHPTVAEAAAWLVAPPASDGWLVDDNDIRTAARRRELDEAAAAWDGPAAVVDVDAEVG